MGSQFLPEELVDEPLVDVERQSRLADRFGPPPPEVDNLLYAVRIKGLAAKAGIESISTDEGYIILRRFQGLPFDASRILTKDSIEVGRTQIKIHFRKMGKGWRGILERLLQGV